MNYQAIYNLIIKRAKNRKLEGYKERHHIIPKCLGGSNGRDNLVYLTAKEHFVCHLLLVEIYPESSKLSYALWAMANQSNSKQQRSYRVNSKLYERLRMAHSKRVSIRNTGHKHSEEVKEKIRESNKGKTFSQDSIRRGAEKRTGQKKGPYKPKQAKFEHVCVDCTKSFKSADIKGRFCEECKKPRACQCGCGKIVKTPGKHYASGCQVRGKSYQEIYGTSTPTCGFKKQNYFGKSV